MEEINYSNEFIESLPSLIIKSDLTSMGGGTRETLSPHPIKNETKNTRERKTKAELLKRNEEKLFKQIKEETMKYIFNKKGGIFSLIGIVAVVVIIVVLYLKFF